MSRTTPLPRAACWLIEYEIDGKPRAIGLPSNDIVEYRRRDPRATVRSLDLVAALDVIDEAQHVVDGIGDIAYLRDLLARFREASP